MIFGEGESTVQRANPMAHDDSNLERNPRRPVKPDPKTTHDWSLPAAHLLLEDPGVMAEQRAVDLGKIFDWRLDDVGFPVSALSPCSCGRNDGCDNTFPTMRDRDAGYDHQAYFRHRDGRPMLVCQPYRPAFECGKREGAVAEVERRRKIQIIELDPLLGWYSADPEALPTSLIVWAPR
jgi:hypothetical protein